MQFPISDRLNRSYRCIGIAALLVGLWSSFAYAKAILPHVGGVDFYYYLCHARDQWRGFDVRHWDRHAYFPGVYAFWRTALSLGATSLLQLRAVHLTVMGLNGALVALVVGGAARSVPGCDFYYRWLAAGYAGIWYWVICSRFEGALGTSEPLGTLVFLTGLLAWQGGPLRGGAGWLRCAALGGAIGLALYIKQQIGLLSFGAVSLLPGCFSANRDERHQFRQVAVMPLFAVLAFAVAAALDGTSFAAIATGVQSVNAYSARSTWWRNLYSLARNDESTALMGLLTVPAALALLLVGERRGTANAAVRVAGFAACTAIASLLQFRWRGYYHYFLLTAPELVVAAVLSGIVLAYRYRERLLERSLHRICLIGIALFPLAYTGGNPTNLHAWRVMPPPELASYNTPWHDQPQIADSLRRLSKQFEHIGALLVFPPQRNDVFWFVGKPSLDGYGWGFWDAGEHDPRLGDPRLQNVIVLDVDPVLDLPDWTTERCDALRAELNAGGFRESEKLPGMTAWER